MDFILPDEEEKEQIFQNKNQKNGQQEKQWQSDIFEVIFVIQAGVIDLKLVDVIVAK